MLQYLKSSLSKGTTPTKDRLHPLQAPILHGMEWNTDTMEQDCKAQTSTDSLSDVRRTWHFCCHPLLGSHRPLLPVAESSHGLLLSQLTLLLLEKYLFSIFIFYGPAFVLVSLHSDGKEACSGYCYS